MSQRNPALNPKQGQTGLRATLRVDSSSLRATIHSFTQPETPKDSATPARVATETAAPIIRPGERAQRGKKDARPPVLLLEAQARLCLRTRDHIQDRELDDRVQDRADPAAHW